nr:LEAF RUST 10 DISEASE-RESISTANCE LOCUS RECEPTOR-LIKE PROTEIN KINASE-like 1.4 isoform X2 [Ipomoea batatas]
MNSQSLPCLSFLPLLPILQFFILIPQLHPANLDPAIFDPQDETYYRSCGNMFSCGDISDVGYPFRSENGPAYCGHPGFELSCNEGNTTIDIMNQTYRVLEINQSSKTMKIAREDMMEGKCPQNFFNTTLDNSFFEYTTSYINLTFLYGCHGGINNIPGITTIPCGDINDAYVLPPGGTGVSVNCSRSMIVPVPVEVGGSINSTLLMKELKEGQEIRWKMDSKACDDCTKSEGRCGYNTNQTTCYCHSPPYMSHTCSVSIPTASPGLGIAGAVLAGVGIGWLIFRHKRKRVAANGQVLPVQNIEALPGSTRVRSGRHGNWSKGNRHLWESNPDSLEKKLL